MWRNRVHSISSKNAKRGVNLRRQALRVCNIISRLGSLDLGVHRDLPSDYNNEFIVVRIFVR